MPVLDTSFVIDLMRSDGGAIRLLEDLLTDYDPILVSSVTVMELFHGRPADASRGSFRRQSYI